MTFCHLYIMPLTYGIFLLIFNFRNKDIKAVWVGNDNKNYAFNFNLFLFSFDLFDK